MGDLSEKDAALLKKQVRILLAKRLSRSHQCSCAVEVASIIQQEMIRGTELVRYKEKVEVWFWEKNELNVAVACVWGSWSFWCKLEVGNFGYIFGKKNLDDGEGGEAFYQFIQEKSLLGMFKAWLYNAPRNLI